jgi:hypothetical protein
MLAMRGAVMNKAGFEGLAERLLEVNKIVAKLDPAIRASAFDLLKGYVADEHVKTPPGERAGHVDQRMGPDLEGLISAHPDNRPSENVHLLAADWYGRYGAAPFTVDNLKKAASDAGLTIPDRPDMTLKTAKEGGKKLYQSAGRGLYKPTVPGELFLRKTYSVRKGSGSPLPADKK